MMSFRQWRRSRERAVIDALEFDHRHGFKWRYTSEIAREAGLSRAVTRVILEGLKRRGVVESAASLDRFPEYWPTNRLQWRMKTGMPS
jgi:hypothetical protein